MQPEEEVQLWIIVAGVICLVVWLGYELVTAKEVFVPTCMYCEEKIPEGQYFCDEECKQEYRNYEQYHETKDFE